jgi:hypothetical protein
VPNKNINKSNAQHAIVFEAIALAIAIDAGTELLSAGVRWLDIIVTSRSHARDIALFSLCRLRDMCP